MNLGKKGPLFAIKLVLIMLLPLWITMLYIGVYENQRGFKNISIFENLLRQHKYEEAEAVFNHMEQDNIAGSDLKYKLKEIIEAEFSKFSSALLRKENLETVAYEKLAAFENEISDFINTEFEKTIELYINEHIDYNTALNYFNSMSLAGFSNPDENIRKINEIQLGRDQFNQALQNMNNGSYINAIAGFESVPKSDVHFYSRSLEYIEQCRESALEQFYSGIDSLIENNNFTEARKLLDEALGFFPDMNRLTEKKELISQLEKEWQQKTLVEYKGIVEHIFFHPLIAYPEQAFDNDYQAQGFDDYFVTVKEFKKILENLYAKDFILIDINTMIEEVEENGETVVKRKKLFLPEGKKPLVISIDDMNYYEYMIGNGMVHKLVITDEGKVATLTEQNGEKIISYDNDIVPILDEFVLEHPDFSFNGAKGIIALTGYEGVLGYRTHKDSPNREEEQKAVLPLIQKLKETGWTFACHGYGHLDAASIKYETLERDTNRWIEEVESLLGKTQVYIYPFGSSVKYNENKFNMLYDKGFRIFCAVGPTSYTQYRAKGLLLDRRHMDGIAFRYQKETLLDLFDPDEIMDEARP